MRLHLIDGSGYIYRAFFATPMILERSDGLPCGAIHGYCSMLWRLLRSHEIDPPSHIAVIMDAGRATHRKKAYPDYKAQRPPTHEKLVPQLPFIRTATQAFNVVSVELAGYEADDLIATYTRLAAEAGGEVTIVSGDKDLMQLVGGPVSMLSPDKKAPGGLKRYGAAEVMEKFGVPPERVIDVLALMGDATDNIPGVPTIGEKKATALIQQFGDLDTLLENVDSIENEAIRNAFLWPARRSDDGKRWVPDPTADGHTGAAKAVLSRSLVRLVDDVPDLAALATLERQAINLGQLCEFLELMEFKTLSAEYRGMLEDAA